jgi:hypothetical protein
MSYDLTDTIRVFERHDWHARPWRAFALQDLPREGFIHHGAELNASDIDDLNEQAAAMRAIQNQHMDTDQLAHGGASDIAYHYVVFQPFHAGVHARIFEGRPVHHVPAAQLNHNTGTLAICVYGDFEHHDTLKDNTRWAIECLLTRKPQKTGAGHVVTLGGHRDVVDTACPGDTLYAAIPTIARGAHLRLFREPALSR